MQSTRLFVAAMVIAGLLLPACHKREEEQGPGEKVGKEIDRSMEKLGEGMEEAGKKMQEKSKGE